MSEGAMEGSTTAVDGVPQQAESGSAEAAAGAGASATLNAGAAQEQVSAPAWAQGMDANALQYIEKKGWDKSDNVTAAILQSYQNLDRMKGGAAESMVRIPEPGNAEEQAEFYSRLGVPESPEGYETPVIPTEQGPLNTEALVPISHDLKHTPEQHAQFMQAAGALVDQMAREQFEARNAQLTAEKVALDREWGAMLEENTLAARKGFEALEMDADTIDAMESALGYTKTMKVAAFVGRALSEHRPGFDGDASAGDSLAFGMTRDAARNLVRAKGPELMARARQGDSSAKDELLRLQEIAFHS